MRLVGKKLLKRIRRWIELHSRKIHKSAILSARRHIQIERGAQIAEYVIIRATSSGIKIGSGSQLNPFTVIYGGEGVEIGKNVMIGPHCMLAAGSHDFTQVDIPMRWASHPSKGPIVIEDDVWLGSHVIVTDGITIGTGAVVGAGAVVTKSIPPYGIAMGMPARIVGFRK